MLSMGPDFTEQAEPGIGHCQWCSAQMWYLLYSKASLASSHLLCRGHVSVKDPAMFKTPTISAWLPLQHPLPSQDSPEPCAKDGRQWGTQALQSAAPADLLNFGPASMQRGGISSACCKQLQGGGGETSTARLCSSQQADGSLSLLRNRAPRHKERPKPIHFSERWALKTCALCTTVV